MAGADGEDTFMKNSVDTDVARLRNNNFWDGGNIDLNPFVMTQSTSSIPTPAALNFHPQLISPYYLPQ